MSSAQCTNICSTYEEAQCDELGRVNAFFVPLHERKYVIRIEKDGILSESHIPDLNVCAWKNQELLDKLPDLKTFQSLASNAYWFEKTGEKQKQRCCVQQGTGQHLNIYIATNVVYEAGDKILQAYVLAKGRWNLYETQCEGDYTVFKTERVEAFFIIATRKENVFVVDPTGNMYVHESDNRVQLDFPKGSVQNSETFKIKIYSVKVEEMRKRNEQFPNSSSLIAVTKGLHVEGAKFSKPVRVQLPLENLGNSLEREDGDIEYMFFRIDGDSITHLMDLRFKKLNDTVVTYVDKFSIFVGACLKKAKKIITKELLVSLGIEYPCKLMTFVKKISEQRVQVWCEVVKKEDWKRLEEIRIHEKKLQISSDWESPEIFIYEQDRIRVDIKGSSEVAPEYPKNANRIIFCPIADGMHIFPLLRKTQSVHASSLSTVVYTLDTGDRRVLHTVVLNPWSLKKYKK